MAAVSFAKDVQTLYAAYGKYHSHPVNILIHICFVPTLLITAMSLARHLPIGKDDPTSLTQVHVGFVFLAMCLGLYLYIEPLGGIVATLLYVPGYIYGNYLYITLGASHLQTIALVHAFSWVIQFIGHGVFENRRPALFDNILLTMAAPLFVILEVMFFLGLRPTLQKQCQEALKEELSAKTD